ncbi:MAG: hypothetical protein CSA65_09955 [Proteobacteria bacterium]|nr:MAG: hypothetical protein CSA65_09955 [Pseudomonadota bacterium]
MTLRVEAGAWEGRPVLFNVATPEALESLSQPPVNWEWGGIFLLQGVLQPFVIFVLAAFSVGVGRRNTAARRADSQGASRFGIMVFFLFLVGEGLLSHTLFTPIWGIEIWPIIVGAVFTGVTAWAMYTAGEPLGRRIWPTMFVSSSLLFSQARVPRRDPLIGQSVLVGLIGAGLIFLLDGPLRWDVVEPLLGKPHSIDIVNLSRIIGQRQALGLALNHSMLIGYWLLHIMALVLIRAVVRRPKLAMALTLAVWVLLAGPGSLERVLLDLVSAAFSLFILLRWGVVAFIMQRVALYILWFARPLEMDGWTSQGSLILVGMLILLALYGAWAAMGEGQGQGQDRRESVG